MGKTGIWRRLFWRASWSVRFLLCEISFGRTKVTVMINEQLPIRRRLLITLRRLIKIIGELLFLIWFNQVALKLALIKMISRRTNQKHFWRDLIFYAFEKKNCEEFLDQVLQRNEVFKKGRRPGASNVKTPRKLFIFNVTRWW